MDIYIYVYKYYVFIYRKYIYIIIIIHVNACIYIMYIHTHTYTLYYTHIYTQPPPVTAFCRRGLAFLVCSMLLEVPRKILASTLRNQTHNQFKLHNVCEWHSGRHDP
jgi:hypothetical protein